MPLIPDIPQSDLDAAENGCDRARLIVMRAVACGWITVHDMPQLLATLRIALDTEVRAGGPFLDNASDQPTQ